MSRVRVNKLHRLNSPFVMCPTDLLYVPLTLLAERVAVISWEKKRWALFPGAVPCSNWLHR